MTWIELLAALFGLFGVGTSTIPHVINWPLNLISSLLYCYFFFTIKLYSDSALQIYYVVTSIIGWKKWTKGDLTSLKDQLPISSLNNSQRLRASAVTLGTAFLLGFFFSRYTDASVPYLDATLAALSLLGQWLNTQKRMDSWFVWTIVNTGSVALYLYKAAYITAALYFVFLGMTIVGWVRWRKLLKIQNES